MQHKVIDAKDVVIRFAGDSGDGMQLTGSLFADMSAIFGNELSTFPDYPAEIRAPHGTVSGVSGFQVHIGSEHITTPGDFCDLLVAMNPAALKANAKWLKRTAMVLIDSDTFDEDGLKRAGLKNDPIAELYIEDRTIIVAPITTLTEESLKDSGLDKKTIDKCKNMFTLGMACYIYNRPMEYIFQYLERKFGKKKPEMIAPNRKVLQDGYNYAANIQAIPNTYNIEPAHQEKGLYRNITGNQATAWGLLAAAEKANLPLFCGSYPITPATGILEELAIHKSLGAKTLQAEDEIAGICTAIGAAFAGTNTEIHGTQFQIQRDRLCLATALRKLAEMAAENRPQLQIQIAPGELLKGSVHCLGPGHHNDVPAGPELFFIQPVNFPDPPPGAVADMGLTQFLADGDTHTVGLAPVLPGIQHQ